MTQNSDKPLQPEDKKPGLFTRIFTKMDSAMKEKADTKAKENACCSGKDSKGNKCC